MGVWLCVVEQCLWTIYAYHELNKNKSTALMFIYHFGTINNHFVRMLNSISVGYSLCFHIIRGKVMHFCVAFVVMCAMCGFEYIRHLFWCCHHCVCVWLVVYSFFGQINISDRSTAHAFDPVHIHVVERNSIVVPIPLMSVCFVYACEWMSVYSLLWISYGRCFDSEN